LIYEGPGCSSIGVGALIEHGPFKPRDKNVLVKNHHSWNKGEPTNNFVNPMFCFFSKIRIAD